MDQVVEDIKSRIDIVDLISEYVDLKRSGQNYKGLCPFHSEKTPSFMVSPSKQIFHCFGCNKGGDIITFIMLNEGMTFQEAIYYLARKANIDLQESQKSGIKSGLKDTLFSIYKESALFFVNNLKSSRQAMDYLKERKINIDSIEKFCIGYSTKEKDSLFNHLKRKGFSLEDIKRSGIINFRRSEIGEGAYDFFRDRLMFPIFDLQGRVVAFGGRSLSNLKDIPKYINSPESLIFKKGDLCYGLNFAKNSILEKGYSIIVEGYMDVIMCHQQGITNVIAPLGTALTAGQLKRIKKFSKNLLLLFDGDNAGILAAKRSIQLCYSESFIAKILILPAGDDPDSFLKREGVLEFKKLLSTAITPIEFLLKISGGRKLDAIRDSIRLIISCPDILQREENIKELAERAKINEITIRDEIKNTNPSNKKFFSTVDRHEPRNSFNNKEELLLLSIAILMPDKITYIIENLNLELIDNLIIKNLFQHINILKDNEKEVSLDELFLRCNEEEKGLLTMISLNPEIDKENVDKIIEDCLKTINLKDINRKIKDAIKNEDIELLNQLFSEKKRIREELFERPI
jgi:DNA primase